MSVGRYLRHRLGPAERAASELYRSLFVDLRALASTVVSLQAGLRVVEVGCGEGSFASALLDIDPGAEYLGVDPSPFAGRLFSGDARRVTFVSASLEAVLPSLAGRFDLCLLVDVLHHVPPPERPALLQQSVETLHPGGLLVVKDWEQRRDLATWASRIGDRHLTGDRHVRYFEAEELRELMDEAVPRSHTVVETRVPPRANNLLIVRRRPSPPR